MPWPNELWANQAAPGSPAGPPITRLYVSGSAAAGSAVSGAAFTSTQTDLPVSGSSVSTSQANASALVVKDLPVSSSAAASSSASASIIIETVIPRQAVKAFHFQVPLGTPGTTFFLPLHFQPRLVLIITNGRHEPANTIDNDRSVWQCYGAATSPGERFATAAVSKRGAVQQFHGYRNDCVFTEVLEDGTWGGRLDVQLIQNNGILFTVDAQFQNNHRIFGIAIGGAMQAKIMEIEAPSVNGVQTYTGVGFDPQQAFVFNGRVLASGVIEQNVFDHSFGLVLSPSQQWCIADKAIAGGAGNTVHQTRCGLVANFCVVDHITTVTGILQCFANLTAFITDGFRLNWQLGSPAYLKKHVVVLMAGNYAIDARLFQSLQSIGQHNLAGMPAKPSLTLLVGSGSQLLTTTPTSGLPADNRFGAGGFNPVPNKPPDQWAIAIGDPVDGNIPYSGHTFDSVALCLNEDTGAILHQLDLVSINADGYTLDQPGADSQSRWLLSWTWIDIGVGTPPPSGLCLEIDPGAILFSPDPDWGAGIRERFAWLTDVLPGYTIDEQRIALRKAPRMGLGFRVRAVDRREAGLVESLLTGWQGNRYLVPLWPDKTPLLANAAQGATTLTADTATRRFAAGGRLVLWRDPYTYEIATLAASGGQTIGLQAPLASAWTADGQTWVIPILEGRLPDEQAVRRPADFASELTLDFELLPQPGLEPPASSLPQYQGLDVLDFETSLIPEHTYIRNRFRHESPAGSIYTLDRPKVPAVRRSFYWPMDGRAEIEQFRQFIYNRRGRLHPFWTPTFYQDLILTSDVAAIDTDLFVEKSGYPSLQFAHRKHLALLRGDGSQQILYRGVVAAIEGISSDVVQIDTSPAMALPRLNTKLSFLLHCRLEQDDPELVWHNTQAAEAQLEFLELIPEAPAP